LIPQLDLSLDIVPGTGLGGFEVGVHISRYEELLRRNAQFIPREVSGLWQVVFGVPQLFDATPEESVRFLDASREWRERRSRGEDADLGEVVALIAKPDPTPPALNLWVDLRDGVIDAIDALDAYKGSFRRLRTGMTFADARSVETLVTENSDSDRQARVRGIDGLLLEFSGGVSDEGWTGRDEETLVAITVFDPERSDEGIKSH
jgi:hypothetical protein